MHLSVSVDGDMPRGVRAVALCGPMEPRFVLNAGSRGSATVLHRAGISVRYVRSAPWASTFKCSFYRRNLRISRSSPHDGGTLHAPLALRPGLSQEDMEHTKEIAKERQRKAQSNAVPNSYSSNADAMKGCVGRNRGCSSPSASTLLSNSLSLRLLFSPLPFLSTPGVPS